MKKFLLVLLTIFLSISAVVVGLIAYNNFLSNVKIGNYSPLQINSMSSLTGLTTSTQSYCATCPVKVLEKASSRQFAYITTDSVAPVYLFFTEGRMGLNLTNTYTLVASHTAIPQTFTNYQYASGTYDAVATATITDLNKGLKLTATSSPFIIDLSKQVNSEVWATSTPNAGVQKIMVQYVQ